MRKSHKPLGLIRDAKRKENVFHAMIKTISVDIRFL